MRCKTTFGLDVTVPEFNALGKTGGESYHTLTIAEMPTHNHSGVTSITGAHWHGGLTSTNGNHNHTYQFPATQTAFPGADSVAENNFASSLTENTSTAGAHNHSITVDGDHQHAIANQGGNQAHNNLPPYLVLNYIIKH